MKNIRRGFVCGAVTNPPEEVSAFIAQITTHKNNAIKLQPGSTVIVAIHTAYIPCKIQEIFSFIDRRTGSRIHRNTPLISGDDSAIVKIVPTRSMVVEKYSEYPELGKFGMRACTNESTTPKSVGIGIVLEVIAKDKTLP